ncbi:phosphoribosylglycinamide formyltransferase [Ktedonobacter sp. SOSP1-52]|uniref:phosphoribosylglycinamide formyltransferase n=1 Tax=Ktedonobacter sp. SOSP1-52 TaxID=2778366 RepID=UPI001915E8FA|nr:phosphoribosylglycinamide formyltransferase [Ktedonobacter sp. SOSP1-52]GHO62129.1 phosphoribosylglycinamide formyltransferase [Ktedonobacter sp. SOSP1-52]
MKLKLGFLASHGGSSFQTIYRAIRAGHLDAEACVVISNNSKSAALAFARTAGVPAYHLSLQTESTPELLDEEIKRTLQAHGVQFVVLSGYMKKLGPQTLATYHQRIFNIHPALLPRYGGQGMYGDHVHQAVLATGERETGITIHLIDEHYDHGEILAQCKVPVLSGDTVESLSQRVREREPGFFLEVLQHLAAQNTFSKPLC